MSTFINPTELDLQEESVVCINRVSKATTGGSAMRFNSVVVVFSAWTYCAIVDLELLSINKPLINK